MRQRCIISIAILAFCGSIAANSSSAPVYERKTPIVAAVERVLPSVVDISTVRNITVNRMPMSRFSREFLSPFEDLFETTYRLQGLGSGVIVEGGYVLTNYHVVSDSFGTADQIFVTVFGENRQREATVWGADASADVAILKLAEGESLPQLQWGRSDDLMIGETVIAIGSSLGQPFTVTDGIISALNRSIESDNGLRLSNLIQTNADINKGNSGGPLVNINGEFIGLNSAILSPSGGSVGLGFAIPTSRVKSIYDFWVHNQIALEDRMGIEVVDMDSHLDHYFRTYYETLRDADLDGVVVLDVAPLSLGHDLLMRRDIIQQADGRRITNRDDLKTALEEFRGTTLSLEVIREGKSLTLEVAAPDKEVETYSSHGMTLQALSNPWRRWFRTEFQNGLVISEVIPESIADQMKLRRGDILITADRMELTSLDDWHTSIHRISNSRRIPVDVLQRDNRQWVRRRILLERLNT